MSEQSEPLTIPILTRILEAYIKTAREHELFAERQQELCTGILGETKQRIWYTQMLTERARRESYEEALKLVRRVQP